jgi:4-oxalocrotonate tautomerase
MPHISIDGPRIEDLNKKRQLAKDLTRAAVNAYGLPEETIVVIIKEIAPENVSVGGQLVLDRRARDAK